MGLSEAERHIPVDCEVEAVLELGPSVKEAR